MSEKISLDSSAFLSQFIIMFNLKEYEKESSVHSKFIAGSDKREL